MMLYLENLDFHIPKIIVNCPYIPMSIVAEPIEGTVTPPVGTRHIVKARSQWTEEDKRMVSLDAKAKSHIVISLPDDVYHSVENITTAKEMWETICVAYEGTEEVQENKKMNLLRQYELFFANKGESMTKSYTRFTCLINDLKAAKIDKDNFHKLNKFLDALPNHWNVLITILRNSSKLKTMTLVSLYGTLLNDEQARTQKKNARELSIKGTVLMATNQKKSVFKSAAEEESNDEEQRGEEEVSLEDEEMEDLTTDQMAMLVIQFRKFPMGRMTKGSSFQKKTGVDKSKPTFDKIKAECYNCGKIGHIVVDCRSKKLHLLNH